jgi:hypothetical protein
LQDKLDLVQSENARVTTKLEQSHSRQIKDLETQLTKITDDLLKQKEIMQKSRIDAEETLSQKDKALALEKQKSSLVTQELDRSKL